MRKKYILRLLLGLTLICVLTSLQKIIEVNLPSAVAKGVHGQKHVSHETQIKSSKRFAEVGPHEEVAKVSSVDLKNELDIDNEQKEILCNFKRVGSGVPHSGDIQIFVARMTPIFGSENKNVVWIKSSSCPENHFSIVHFSDDGDISKEIDCRTTDLTEIMKFSGEQGDIIEAPKSPGILNYAISGNGYFVLQCEDQKLLLTRKGTFVQNSPSHFAGLNNCILLNEEGFSFSGTPIDSKGCTSAGECMATVDPAFDQITNLKYLNSFSFTAERVQMPNESVTKVGPMVLRPTFFAQHLEDLSNPDRGITGVSWTNHPRLNLNDIECN